MEQKEVLKYLNTKAGTLIANMTAISDNYLRSMENFKKTVINDFTATLSRIKIENILDEETIRFYLDKFNENVNNLKIKFSDIEDSYKKTESQIKEMAKMSSSKIEI